MVAIVKKRIKIYKGQTPDEEIQQAFKDEMIGIMKDAALKMGCDVNWLKYRVDNLGRVEVAKMTEEEMVKSETERLRVKRLKAIRKIKGLN